MQCPRHVERAGPAWSTHRDAQTLPFALTGTHVRPPGVHRVICGAGLNPSLSSASMPPVSIGLPEPSPSLFCGEPAAGRPAANSAITTAQQLRLTAVGYHQTPTFALLAVLMAMRATVWLTLYLKEGSAPPQSASASQQSAVRQSHLSPHRRHQHRTHPPHRPVTPPHHASPWARLSLNPP